MAPPRTVTHTKYLARTEKLAAGLQPEEREVIDFVGERIARYKRPRAVMFVPALPTKADGSNDRVRIRRLYG